MRVKKGFVLRQVAEQYIVVPVGEAAKNFRGMITLNEVGAFIWRALENDVSEQDIVTAILAEYDAAEDVVINDVACILAKMKEANLLD